MDSSEACIDASSKVTSLLVYNINVNKVIILDIKEVGFLCQSDAAGYKSPFGIKAIHVHLRRHTGRSRWEVASPVMRQAKEIPFLR